MNFFQRVNRLEETVERISESLDGFIENANRNVVANNKNIERIQEGFELVFKEIDELKVTPLKQKEVNTWMIFLNCYKKGLFYTKKVVE